MEYQTHRFHILIAVLLENYEPLISEALKKRDYVILNADLQQNVLSSQKCLFYSVLTNKSIDKVEFELCYDILREQGIKYHFYGLFKDVSGFDATWRGSNINYRDVRQEALLSANSKYIVPSPSDTFSTLDEEGCS